LEKQIMSKSAIITCLLMAMGALVVGSSHAQLGPVVLITADEAKLPLSRTAHFTSYANVWRGISRGPAIELLSPKPSKTSIQSPVHLQLKFEARGGAQIDVDSFKLTYVRTPPVDLTDRVKTFVKPGGVDVPKAEIPPGTQTIRAEIKDNDGRAGSLTFNLNVAMKQ
jgi:hypothetical protein